MGSSWILHASFAPDDGMALPKALSIKSRSKLHPSHTRLSSVPKEKKQNFTDIVKNSCEQTWHPVMPWDLGKFSRQLLLVYAGLLYSERLRCQKYSKLSCKSDGCCGHSNYIIIYISIYKLHSRERGIRQISSPMYALCDCSKHDDEMEANETPSKRWSHTNDIETPGQVKRKYDAKRAPSKLHHHQTWTRQA